MKHNPISTANAFAITTGIFYVACRILVGLFPNLMFTVAQSWFHGVALTKFDTSGLNISTFLMGLVSSFVFAWVAGYIFSKIYNLMKS
ncbi:MAG: DUF5676 family membrane protein [Candidatus Woesebacteria bacterium]|nr:DUF5676 family membrane protein [Candidatus Woesebacteria bacterium]